MIDIEIKCNECGNLLGDGDVSNNCLHIDPCKTCLDAAYAEGEEAGCRSTEDKE